MLNNGKWTSDERNEQHWWFHRPDKLKAFLRGDISIEQFVERFPIFDIYLDDCRRTPSLEPSIIPYENCEELHCFSVDEVILLLSTGRCRFMSLDNSLGLLRQGYEVMDWLEKEVIENDLTPPEECTFHTGDTPAKIRMQKTWKRIKNYLDD